jgi:hypothetical protein
MIYGVNADDIDHGDKNHYNSIFFHGVIAATKHSLGEQADLVIIRNNIARPIDGAKDVQSDIRGQVLPTLVRIAALEEASGA